MTFQTRTVDSVSFITLPGANLDASNANEFRRAILPLLEERKQVVFDLSEVQFVDSSGLGAILSCLRTLNGAGGDLKLCQMQNSVRVLFEMVRMHRIIDILDTPESAQKAFGA